VSGLTNGTTYGIRVCAVDNAGNTGAGVTTTVKPIPETSGPTGALVLGGGATWSSSATVTATISSSDASAVTEMCLSATTRCTRWLSAAASGSINFGRATAATGYLWLKDEWGNVGGPYTDTIRIDTVKPVDGTLSRTQANGAVALSWAGFSDAASGLASYVVKGSTSTAPGAACASGETLYSGTATSFTHSGLTNGQLWSYRVCAVDVAGNTSTGSTTTGMGAPESAAPVGTVVINSGAALTRSRTVTLTLAATDATDVAQVCLSATSSCTSWRSYASSLSYSLGTTQGSQTVYAAFKDSWGNTSSAVSDTITLDSVAPRDGSLTATGSGTTVSASWSGYSDAGSGISGYTAVIVAGTSAPRSGCTSGTAGTVSGTAATFAGLSAGQRYTVRVCAVDAAGNTSAGRTAAVTL
jgi:hypothetical protein